MIKTPSMPFFAGMSIGVVAVVLFVPGTIMSAAEEFDCEPANTVQWDAECDQVGAAMRMVSILTFPLLLGEVFSYAARRYRGRKQGR